MKNSIKLKDLKGILDVLDDKQLDQSILYYSKNLCMSGCVSNFVKSKCNLYWDGSSDPAELLTKNKLIEEGYDKEDIESFELVIKKGDFYITF